MILRQFTRISVVGLFLAIFTSTSTAFAQKFEAFAYGGAIFPSATSIGQFVNTNIWGAKGGIFLSPQIELEGSFGFVNHFDLNQDPNPLHAQLGLARPASRAFLYDFLGSYNFGERRMLGTRVAPYLTLGAGVLHATVDDPSSVLIHAPQYEVNPATGLVVPNPNGSTVLNSGSDFFNFSYGGGVKAMNMFGPMGLRADIRGRTIPNFFGRAINWLPEITGGIIFTFGER